MLEAVAGAAAYQPDVVKFRVAINQEITVGGVFVLADARFDDGRIFQGGEAARDEFLRGSESFGAGYAGLCVGINARAVAIVGDFEAAGFDVRHSVEFVFQV